MIKYITHRLIEQLKVLNVLFTDIIDFAIPHSLLARVDRNLSCSFFRNASFEYPRKGCLSFITSNFKKMNPKSFCHSDILEHYLLFGNATSEGIIEAFIARQMTVNSHVVLNYVNSWFSHGAVISGQLQYHGKKIFTELAYTSDSNLIGIRTLYHLSKDNIWQLAFGGELYFGLKDRAGGISLGTRLLFPTDKPLILASTINPIMGHFSINSSAKITNELTLANRFDFNMYSFESDISFGLEYRTLENALLKLRFGLSQGIGILYQLSMKSCTFKIGLSTEIKENAKKSFGAEFIF